jgi:hypothetical protein
VPLERIQPEGLALLPLFTNVVKAGNTLYIADQVAPAIWTSTTTTTSKHRGRTPASRVETRVTAITPSYSWPS